MNRSEKYYFKEGKLELSMLEDQEDEIRPMVPSTRRRDLLNNLEWKHTKRRRKKKRSLSQPKLKVSKDVYDTLHTMGQFLTKQDEKVIELSSVQPRESTIKKLNSVKKLQGMEEQVAQEGNHEEEKTKEESVEIYKPVLEENEALCREGEEPKLSQNSIDDIVNAFFSNHSCCRVPYIYSKELKEHIDKKIGEIQNYK